MTGPSSIPATLGEAYSAAAATTVAICSWRLARIKYPGAHETVFATSDLGRERTSPSLSNADPVHSPVFDAPQAALTVEGRPASRRSRVSRRAQGGSRAEPQAESGAALDAAEHGGRARGPHTPSVGAVPSCSAASRRPAAREVLHTCLDPACARRLTRGRRDAGRPFVSSTHPAGGRTQGWGLGRSAGRGRGHVPGPRTCPRRCPRPSARGVQCSRPRGRGRALRIRA